MKVMDIIDRVDMMEPNQYSPEQKIRWLSTLDGKIFEEVIRTHEGQTVENFTPYVNGNEELIIGDPYGEDIYYNYLQMKIAQENSEANRYNRRATMFSSLYQEWVNYYNRTHLPRRTGLQFI